MGAIHMTHGRNEKYLDNFVRETKEMITWKI